MDSFVMIAVLAALFVLPVLGARWSFISSLVIAGVLVAYGLAAIVFSVIDYKTNSDLAIGIGAIVAGSGVAISVIAWIFRRRAIRKATQPWN